MRSLVRQRLACQTDSHNMKFKKCDADSLADGRLEECSHRGFRISILTKMKTPRTSFRSHACSLSSRCLQYFTQRLCCSDAAAKHDGHRRRNSVESDQTLKTSRCWPSGWPV